LWPRLTSFVFYFIFLSIGLSFRCLNLSCVCLVLRLSCPTIVLSSFSCHSFSSPKIVLFYVCLFLSLSFLKFVFSYVLLVLGCLLHLSNPTFVPYLVCLVTTSRLSYTTFVLFYGCRLTYACLAPRLSYLKFFLSQVVLVPIEKHFAGKITLNVFKWIPLNPDNIMNTFWSSAIFQLYYFEIIK